jgi:hypothetical protein
LRSNKLTNNFAGLVKSSLGQNVARGQPVVPLRHTIGFHTTPQYRSYVLILNNGHPKQCNFVSSQNVYFSRQQGDVSLRMSGRVSL